MKTTLNVNIGGVPFIMDEDAFNALRKYLNEIEIRVSEDSGEIMEDIESRIADIFNENISPRIQVVNIDLVKRAIAIIGSAREFGEPVRSMPYDDRDSRDDAPKRLYRSRTNVMIGGVCAGLAEYFNVDLTLVRVLTFCLVFFGGLSLWVYIVLWIVIPREPLPLPGETAGKQKRYHNDKRY